MSTPTLAALREKPHWSYSAINLFLNVCSLQWAFKYLYHEPAMFTPVNMVFGKSYHQALEYAAGQLQAGRTPDRKQVGELFADLFTQSCKLTEPKVQLEEGEDISHLLDTGRNMLTAYLGSLDPAEKVLGVSRAFAVQLEDAAGSLLEKPLIGEFDLVVEVGGKVVLVDWKTSARRWPESKVWTDLQPTCYLYAASRTMKPAPAGFRFDVVTKGKTPAVDQHKTVRGAEHFLRLTEMVKVMEKIIRAEAFLPNDQSWACAGCSYASACASWQHRTSREQVCLSMAA